MRQKYGDRIYGRYGFVDAFNPNTGWINPDVIAIDQGIILLSVENARTSSIWRWFMKNPEIPRALRRVGLVKYKDGPRRFMVSSARGGFLPTFVYRLRSSDSVVRIFRSS